MLLRYYHTLKYLRLTQILGRFQRKVYRPKPSLKASPPIRVVVVAWYAHHWRASSMLSEDRFRLLNDERELVFPEGWNAPSVNKLWLYNLHYFDDLNAIGAEARRRWHEVLIRRWVRDNPPVSGNGWEAYPLSLRIVNWIKWSLAGNRLEADAVHSLAVQSRQLRQTLEFHLLGNHLFENAKALVFAGLYFSGEEAEDWFQTGAALLEEQIKEQVLADGGHFELSPMYHCLILEGLLDLKNLYHAFKIELPDAWREAIARMFDWLNVMSHPDGGIAFFNDAAFGVAPCLNELACYARNLGINQEPSKKTGTRWLSASGYVRLEQNDVVVIADVAAIGPDYLPGHAHADSLSFELSLHGQRVLVNSGTSIYGVGLERLRQRGTAAHNTLRLDGADSSEVWSGFRVARRARTSVNPFVEGDNLSLEAVHDGYKRLSGRPTHRRIWDLGSHGLQVRDVVEGGGNHFVEIFFHFHPDIRLEEVRAATFLARWDGGRSMLELQGDKKLTWQIVPGFWHPYFGMSVPNLSLRGCCHGDLPMEIWTELSWSV